MICFSFILFLISVILKSSNGVQVQLQGSVRIGKEVVDTLSHFASKNKLGGRRSFGDGRENDDDSDTIALIVNSAFLCRDLNFCKDNVEKFLNNYIITLTKTVESIFKGLINDIDKHHSEKKETPITFLFEEELRQLLFDINKLLIKSDEKITERNEAYTWIDILKRINTRFQDAAIAFASNRLEGNAKDVTEVKNRLTQKIITETTVVELKFEDNLCIDHNICSGSHECTIALNTLLEEIIKLPDNLVKEFIRFFYETLPATNFYYKISEVTAHEFQTILHDMAYAENMPAKNILSVVHKIVADRLNSITSMTKVDKPSGGDRKLIHVMLSDMDHFYNKEKKEPFHEFIGEFFEWSKKGDRFSSQIRHVMMDVQNMLSFESDELVLKLIREMKVFMEITVDPDQSKP